MKWFLSVGILVLLVSGCKSASTGRQERAAALASLPSGEREMVESGRIAPGMGTNAVFIALGPPSQVLNLNAGDVSGSDEVWVYYGDRPVLVPRWTYLPDPYGYWTPQYTPGHYSQRQVKAEVRFRNGRVTDWKTW